MPTSKGVKKGKWRAGVGSAETAGPREECIVRSSTGPTLARILVRCGMRAQIRAPMCRLVLSSSSAAVRP